MLTFEEYNEVKSLVAEGAKWSAAVRAVRARARAMKPHASKFAREVASDTARSILGGNNGWR